ncbi:MAG: RNA polymerase factor sigma-32 [Thermodesulfobacteriota bacterium]|nr:RNA polymerase factor sigma-32 [Thermodesulfobacteriota bacterium]
MGVPAVRFMADHGLPAELIRKIESLPVLSREEEFDLAVRFREYNDADAAHKLVMSNIRNVVRIAMNYTGYGLPMEDIIQEGTIGLMLAVKKFDPYKGYRLMSYAMWWIKAMIHDYILKFYSQVKIGTTKLQKKLFYGLNQLSYDEKVFDETSQRRSDVLAAKLDADPKQVQEIVSRLTQRDQSLESAVSDDSDASFKDFLVDAEANPEEEVIDKEKGMLTKYRIEHAFKALSTREQDIARQRLMAEKPATLDDLGKHYNISKERVRQIEFSVKNKLKKALGGNLELAT